MNFDGVEKIAAAILYEGYILYPYRPTAIKNRQRWNFGTLYPRVYAQAQHPEEPFRLVAECLVLADANASLDVKISFLQLVRQARSGLEKLTDPSLAWDEAVERSSEHSGLRLNDLWIRRFRCTVRRIELQTCIEAHDRRPACWRMERASSGSKSRTRVRCAAALMQNETKRSPHPSYPRTCCWVSPVESSFPFSIPLNPIAPPSRNVRMLAFFRCWRGRSRSEA